MKPMYYIGLDPVQAKLMLIWSFLATTRFVPALGVGLTSATFAKCPLSTWSLGADAGDTLQPSGPTDNCASNRQTTVPVRPTSATL
jgi:hypothetical protein